MHCKKVCAILWHKEVLLIGDNMKKGYYIHFQGRDSVGISKKLDMQIEEFSRYFAMQELEVETIDRTLFQRIIGLWPTMSIKRNYQNALDELDNPDFIYVRRNVADKEYVNFWKKIKQKYPDCKIIIEIFTYPYDKDDFGKWNAWPFYIKERLYRPKLKKYIERFVTYSDDEIIFGIPTIITTNGVIVDKIRKISGEYKPNCIKMIGVAYMQRQHGYERVIEGMREYYAKGVQAEKVYLDLVGDGPEKAKYQKLVEKYGLEQYVNFYPIMTGAELDDLYDQADIALAAFGMYKVGYYSHIGAIKTRECLAKGIPLISGSPIDVLDEDFAYVKIFPNDNSAVDIAQVVQLYHRIISDGQTKEEVAEEIRTYARNKVDMSAVMKPIMDYIVQ